MESAAQSLVGNVGQLLGAEYRLLRGVGGEVAELRDDLATMNALLHMQSEVDEGAVDHFVREWMKQLRELAYDAEDCVNHYKLRIKCRSTGDMRTRLKHMFETLFPRHRLAGEIRALRARAIAVSERHARYCANRDALCRSTPVMAASMVSARALRPGDVVVAELHHQPIGIDGQVDTLARQLKAEVDGERQLKVFSIVGFGGLGKTTLAMEVCRRLEPEFPCQAMVAVSQAFEAGRDVVALLKRMLQQIVKPKMENEKGVKEEEALGDIDGLDGKKLFDKLTEIVKHKRYDIHLLP
ncbi:hypothetical protein C2845_PM07G38950 [Panicum miliaceum]|uniref:Uncharacterized protein n=1 Tax=Panicum miliaceum TaxID=4540 RepID=A0A3L6SPH2_PANMI|nr:hypothetical protein C2845_PM07G38950 [Panicum miliaceum]